VPGLGAVVPVPGVVPPTDGAAAGRGVTGSEGDPEPWPRDDGVLGLRPRPESVYSGVLGAVDVPCDAGVLLGLPGMVLGVAVLLAP
jgi:hypothetical protein